MVKRIVSDRGKRLLSNQRNGLLSNQRNGLVSNTIKRIASLMLGLLLLYPSVTAVTAAEGSGSIINALAAAEGCNVVKLKSPRCIRSGKMGFIDVYNQNVYPVLKDGIVLYPARAFADDFSIQYQTDGTSFTLSTTTVTIAGSIGAAEVLVNGTARLQVVAPYMRDDHIMLSLSLMADAFRMQYSRIGDYIAFGGKTKLQGFSSDTIKAFDKLFSEEKPFIHYGMNWSVKDVASLKNKVSAAMAMSDEQLAAMVPKNTPRASEPFDPETGLRMKKTTWSLNAPDFITDAATGISYPNAKTPMKMEKLLTLMGTETEAWYYEDRFGKKSYYTDRAAQFKWNWAKDQIRMLGYLYYYTENLAYAQKCKLLLKEMAAAMPHYYLSGVLQDGTDLTLSTGGFYMTDGEIDMFINKGLRSIAEGVNVNKQAEQDWLDANRDLFDTTKLDWEWEPGKAPAQLRRPAAFHPLARRVEGRWSYEPTSELAEGYALTKPSGIYTKEEIAAIHARLFRNQMDFVFALPQYETIYGGNLIVYIAETASMATLIGEPKYVHLCYNYLKTCSENYCYTRDGVTAESPAYFFTYISGLGRLFLPYMGYSDPPGYVDGFTGLHLENVSIYKDFRREWDLIKLGRKNAMMVQYPDGALPPIHDSAANLENMQGNLVNRLSDTNTLFNSCEDMLFDGTGSAVLGSGSFNEKVQTILHYSDDAIGHSHQDGLNLIFNVFGRQMLDDIGYNRSALKFYTAYSFSHNLVLVDRTNQNMAATGQQTNGSVDYYATNHEGVSVVSVDGRSYYTNPLGKYKRTVMQNASDLSAPYLLDIFEVEGGSMHDYILNGTRTSQQTVETTNPVTPVPGEHPYLLESEPWNPPKQMTDHYPGEGYGALTNAVSGAVTDSFVTDFKFIDPYAEGSPYAEGTYYYDAEAFGENYLHYAGVYEGSTLVAYPGLAVDDDAQSFYTAPIPFSVAYDMGEVKTVDCVRIRQSRDGTSYSVEVSENGKSWKTVADNTTHGTILKGTQTIGHILRFPETKARYIRYSITGGGGTNIFLIEASDAPDIKQFDKSLDVGMKVHTVIGAEKDAGSTEVILADTLAVKQTSPDVYHFDDQTKAKTMLIRRQGEEGLKSVYVNVIEPYMGESKITGITPLADGHDRVVLKIEMGDRVDLVAVNLNGSGETNIENTLRTDATFAYVSNNGGKLMSGGTYLETAAGTVFANRCGKVSGDILSFTSRWDGAEKNEFILDKTFNIADIPEGSYVKVKLGTYIGRVAIGKNLAAERDGTSVFYKITNMTEKDGKIHMEVSTDTSLRDVGDGVYKSIFYPFGFFKGALQYEISCGY